MQTDSLRLDFFFFFKLKSNLFDVRQSDKFIQLLIRSNRVRDENYKTNKKKNKKKNEIDKWT